jgi:hypothetical protein
MLGMGSSASQRRTVRGQEGLSIDKCSIRDNNIHAMSCTMVLTFAAFLFALMFAQQAPISQPAPAAQADSKSADRDQIQGVLRRYQTAYQDQDMEELLAIWPGLQNDQKERKKYKKEFDRADITHMKVVLEPEDIQFPTKDEAVVKSKCNEQYIQVVFSSYSSGDATIGGIVAQRPGPTNSTEKKTVKKTSDIWMTMHRDGNGWTIVSISDKKPR